MKKNKIVLVFLAVAAIALANMHLSVNETEKSDLSITAFRNAEAVGCSECYAPYKCDDNECIYPRILRGTPQYACGSCEPNPGWAGIRYCIDWICEYDYQDGTGDCVPVYGFEVACIPIS